MPLSEDTCEMGVGGSIESVQVASWESRGTVTAMAATERVVVTGMKDGSLVKVSLITPFPRLGSIRNSSNCPRYVRLRSARRCLSEEPSAKEYDFS